MRIGINLLRFNEKTIGGNYVYAKNIIHQLIKISEHNLVEIIVFCSNKKDCLALFELDNSQVQVVEFYRFNPLIDMHLFMKSLCRQHEIDVFFSPNHLLPLHKPECKTLITIHDLNFKHFSQGFLKDLYKNVVYKLSILKTDKIIAISDFTKNDIIAHFQNTDPQKIRVIHNGIEKINVIQYDNLNLFLLGIGHHEHKNALFLLDIYGAAKEYLMNKNIRLKIFGLKAIYREKVEEKAKQLGIYNMCDLYGYISDEDVKKMYSTALVFIFPTQFEGFGLPLLEAMYAKCPVVTSDRGAIPEIAEDAAIIIDNFDPRIWADNLIMILDDKVKSDELVRKGERRVMNFSWETCGKHVYETIIEMRK